MGSVARLAAVGSAFALAACAVIAGLDEPSAVDEPTSGSSSSGSVQDTGNASSSGGGSSSGSSGSDGSSSSGNPDAQPDAPACTLLKNGDTCNQPSQCCSKKCSERRECVSDCDGESSFTCAPGSTNECCVGLWCNNFGGCVPCITSGQPAALSAIGSIPMSNSCCSRQLQNGTGPNCQ